MPARSPAAAAAPIDSIIAQLRAPGQRFTPAERKVIRTLFASSMLAGLDTVAGLAGRVGVSGPTVIRLTAKLGFASYAAFQRQLRGELEQRSDSPLSLYEKRGEGSGPFLARAREGFIEAVRASFDRVAPADLEDFAALLCDRKRRIVCAGGRFSQLVAQMLYLHLFQMRDGVSMLQQGLQSRRDQLLELGARSVLVVYDFRRYQADTVEIARLAKAQGATILLITDPWQSPIAAFANRVLIADVQAPSAYDTMVPAFALTEALIGSALARLGPAAISRIRALERLREGFEYRGEKPSAEGRAKPKRGRHG